MENPIDRKRRAVGTPPVFCRLSSQSLDDIVEIEAECGRPPWSRRLLEEEFSKSHSIIFGARVGGRLIAFIIGHLIVDEAHVLSFGVRANCRGQGIGRGLIVYALEQFHTMGARWATLEVRRGNKVARSLYESLGFNEIGVREKYYSDNLEDAIVHGIQLRDFVLAQATKHLRKAM